MLDTYGRYRGFIYEYQSFGCWYAVKADDDSVRLEVDFGEDSRDITRAIDDWHQEHQDDDLIEAAAEEWAGGKVGPARTALDEREMEKA